MNEEIDFTQLKYVLYARKSTTDEERQVRSIEDQISDCQKLAERMGLHIVETLREEKSAKIPNKRPVFTQLLKDLKIGKYDGILAWNPDRLARNMLEAGRIIDMIDTGQIVDLKFVTHHFTKDANGKMLLGMSFVLSKQYSDDLSQKVTRGVRNRLSEGKTPTPKHGYTNTEGYYYPDGRNHDLICKAWKMRHEGTSLKKIAEEMNSLGYYRETKKRKIKIRLNDKILSKLFQDPFYYGMLEQMGQSVDLRQLYEFIPAVSEEAYFDIQFASRKLAKPYQSKNKTFYPFRKMISCSHCGNHMYIGPSLSGNKKNLLLYARCDTEGCERKKKSIRVNIPLNFIYDFLEEGLHFTENDYNSYYKNLKSINEIDLAAVRTKIHNKRGILKRVEAEVKEISLGLLRSNIPEIAKKQGSIRLEQLNKEIETLQIDLVALENQLRDPEKDNLTLEQFLNLSKNAAAIVKAADAPIKDAICRYIFLNITVDEEKVVSYQLKEPFATLAETRKLQTGRGGRTRTADLTYPKRALFQLSYTPINQYSGLDAIALYAFFHHL